MSKKKSENKQTALTAPHKKENFRGYTISELRHQRILTQVRMEFIKEKLVNDARTLTSMKFMTGDGNSKVSNMMMLASRGLRLFSYADLIALGVALFRGGRRVYSIFKHK